MHSYKYVNESKATYIYVSHSHPQLHPNPTPTPTPTHSSTHSITPKSSLHTQRALCALSFSNSFEIPTKKKLHIMFEFCMFNHLF